MASGRSRSCPLQTDGHARHCEAFRGLTTGRRPRLGERRMKWTRWRFISTVAILFVGAARHARREAVLTGRASQARLARGQRHRLTLGQEGSRPLPRLVEHSCRSGNTCGLSRCSNGGTYSTHNEWIGGCSAPIYPRRRHKRRRYALLARSGHSPCDLPAFTRYRLPPAFFQRHNFVFTLVLDCSAPQLTLSVDLATSAEGVGRA